MSDSLQYYGRQVCADCNIPSEPDYITLGERGCYDCLDAPSFIPTGGHHRLKVDQHGYSFGAPSYSIRD